MNSTPRRFAFLIHPRVQVAQDLGDLFWSPLRHLPNSFYETLLRRLPVRPLVSGRIQLGTEAEGELITVPLSARQLLQLPRPEVQARVKEAVEMARSRGATVVGLGALTAPVSDGGRIFADRTDIGVTNGNAFTAAMTWMGMERILSSIGRHAHVAIVGASGSVGSCLVRLLVQKGTCSSMTLVARNLERLEHLKAEVAGQDVDIDVTTDMMQVKKADLVVLLTSASDAVLKSEHLKKGAWVLDDTQPRNTDPTLLTERPDVTVVDGGLVEMTGMRMQGTIGLARNLIYACLAETLLLSLNGHQGHFSIGHPTAQQASMMLDLAVKHQQFGFRLAPFRSFGRLLEPEVSPENLAWQVG
ncbi:saccharopine dehydrogenase NADP-binding domain-containing protein [Deinococcus cellulosilyticus]|uniref:Shikimate 5-dehydrogenase n=1 Tax=Deinococcus cellulosilyticus (strain DSM 18568 / NBRC 106333 / KACC 11606 / 5516J-15) TaxID=1223518 RepID=A0A511N2X4_DEIC1|nr:saccharopine dehydrogenase NADP-binding domain-containing protein [Deinococcus cellulosilyticus]GEM46857.1 shikimate 5-dehydrogenase [Deinococcus cellulosilyticus NBRC 106333 = KACC 11606]